MAEPSQIKSAIERVKKHIRVTKVVGTRAVKTKDGDFFAGISAAWDTTQDDAGGPGADLDLVMSSSEIAQGGMTLLDARVSSVVVAMEASINAWRAAMSEGAVSEDQFNSRSERIRARAQTQIAKILDKAASQPQSTEKAA